MVKQTAIVADLRAVFARFPRKCLQHLRENRQWLVRRAYRTAEGRGCLMFLLSERLPPELRIDSKPALTRFFGNGNPQAPQYQPAKWIVRLWDRQVCSEVRARYGDDPELSEDLLFSVLQQVLAERTAGRATALQNRRRLQEVGDSHQPARYRRECSRPHFSRETACPQTQPASRPESQRVDAV